jgi:hypothetical protein
MISAILLLQSVASPGVFQATLKPDTGIVSVHKIDVYGKTKLDRQYRLTPRAGDMLFQYARAKNTDYFTLLFDYENKGFQYAFEVRRAFSDKKIIHVKSIFQSLDRTVRFLGIPEHNHLLIAVDQAWREDPEEGKIHSVNLSTLKKKTWECPLPTAPVISQFPDKISYLKPSKPKSNNPEKLIKYSVPFSLVNGKNPSWKPGTASWNGPTAIKQIWVKVLDANTVESRLDYTYKGSPKSVKLNHAFGVKISKDGEWMLLAGTLVKSDNQKVYWSKKTGYENLLDLE